MHDPASLMLIGRDSPSRSGRRGAGTRAVGQATKPASSRLKADRLNIPLIPYKELVILSECEESLRMEILHFVQDDGEAGSRKASAGFSQLRVLSAVIYRRTVAG